MRIADTLFAATCLAMLALVFIAHPDPAIQILAWMFAPVACVAAWTA